MQTVLKTVLKTDMIRSKALMRMDLASILLAFLFMLMGCEEEKEHIAPAIYDRDSVSVMVTHGVNTLISDSGVIRYRIVTEEWEVNQIRRPSRWIFVKGLFLEQFDQNFHIQSFIQADTAYYYDEAQLWELRGRVRVRTKDGLRFSSEELFWNQWEHVLYSHKFSHVITPEREMQGTYFRSNEYMTKYTVSNSKGSFVKSDIENEGDTIVNAPDSVKAFKRKPARSKPKTTSQP